ncbi:hypothetical protein GF377_00430 [candidate division GN15 bacterium]|nr:hypothetical protein [candidate division GN15 bacterium]
MSTMFWIWMAIAVVFLIVELATPTMIFICFTAGAMGAGLFTLYDPAGYYWQLAIFVIVSVGLIPLTRKFAKKITSADSQMANVDRLIGQVAMVTERIDPDLGGKVRFEGEIWRAGAAQAIEAMEKVRINGVSGTRVMVERLEEQ